MTQPQSNLPAPVRRIPSPAEQLQRALRSGGFEPAARLAFALLPNARPLFERVAWFVSEFALHPTGHRLLGVMLNDAFRTSERLHKVFPTPAYAEQRVTIYTALFRSLPDLNMVRAATPDGQVWDPLSGDPLSNWLARHRQATVELLEEPNDVHGFMTPVDFRSALAPFILNERDMVDLGEHFPQVMGVGYR